MNLRRTIFKLQTALCQKGRMVKINQIQNWSDKAQRMVTKFVVIENGETVLSSYQAAEIVKGLAEMLGGD